MKELGRMTGLWQKLRKLKLEWKDSNALIIGKGSWQLHHEPVQEMFGFRANDRCCRRAFWIGGGEFANDKKAKDCT